MAKSQFAKANDKIAEKVAETYEKVENTVVQRYTKIENAFVNRYLTRDGETIEEAKKRMREQRP